VLDAESDMPCFISMCQADKVGSDGIRSALAEEFQQGKKRTFAHHTEQERGGGEVGFFERRFQR
jgi:hypothetical protein